MLKAECPLCDADGKPYVVRIAATPAREIGPPICPKHKQPLDIDFPPEMDEGEDGPRRIAGSRLNGLDFWLCH